MIYPSDISKLTSQWTERMSNSSYPQPYRDALMECCNELNTLIDNSIQEEFDYKDYLDSMEADNYLAYIEAHEQYY